MAEYEQYKADGLTSKQIAAIKGCSTLVVHRRLKELGVLKTRASLPKFCFYNEKLSDEQIDLLVGTLLGDGGLTISNAYQVNHSVKQLAYIEHKVKILSNICSGKIHKTTGVDPNGNKTNGLHFCTGTHPYLKCLRNLFYLEGKKIVPISFLKDNLTPRALAYWYQDDGSLHHRKVVRLHTQGFTLNEQKLLQTLLKEVYDFDTNLHKCQGGCNFHIALTVASSKQFLNTVKPYIHNSLSYKINELV